MNIGLVSDCLASMPFEKMIAECKKMGIKEVELGVGNWSSAPHINLDELLQSEVKRNEMKEILEQYGVKISAFNCSGNPLAPGEWGKSERLVTKKCFELCKYFDVEKVVMMSGLPAAGPNDSFPNWIVTSWPPETQGILNYQWNEVAIPYWKETVKIANEYGVNKIALEPHGSQLVYNTENFFKLREACGNNDTIGFNLDPSHLFWMGADPLEVVKALDKYIYHVHIKDIRVEIPSRKNTMLDGKHVLDFASRSWNFSIPGYGHDEYWWSKFIVALKMIKYDGVLSIEHEDYTMDTLTGLAKTVNLLERILL